MLQTIDDYEYLKNEHPEYRNMILGDVIPFRNMNEQASLLRIEDVFYLYDSFKTFCCGSGINTGDIMNISHIRYFIETVWKQLYNIGTFNGARVYPASKGIETFQPLYTTVSQSITPQTFLKQNNLNFDAFKILTPDLQNTMRFYDILPMLKLYWCLNQECYKPITYSSTTDSSFSYTAMSVDGTCVMNKANGDTITTYEIGYQNNGLAIEPRPNESFSYSWVSRTRTMRTSDGQYRLVYDGLKADTPLVYYIDLHRTDIKSAYALVRCSAENSKTYRYQHKYGFVKMTHHDGTIWKMTITTRAEADDIMRRAGIDIDSIGQTFPRQSTPVTGNYDVQAINIFVNYKHKYVFDNWKWQP